MSFKHSLIRVALVTALVGTASAACDDSNTNDKPGEAGSSAKAGKSGGSGKSGSSGNGAKAGSDAESGAGGSENAGSGGTGGASDHAGSGGSGDCKGAMDCFSCEPTQNADFLNHCTEATCNPFDNSKLTKIKDGKLPEIP